MTKTNSISTNSKRKTSVVPELPVLVLEGVSTGEVGIILSNNLYVFSFTSIHATKKKKKVSKQKKKISKISKILNSFL